MTPAERLKKITETVQEFLAEGKALSSNDLLRVLSKRMPGWKPTKEDIVLMEEEIMSQRKQVHVENDLVEVDGVAETQETQEAPETQEAQENVEAVRSPIPRQPASRQGVAATIQKLKELLQHNTKEDLFALLTLMELAPPK